MDSFELELDEQSRVGSEFMARVVNEIRRAVASEKATRKLTQQAIADKIGTSRAVINRQIQGLENLSARRIGEILWAIGWEPYFEARRKPIGENQNLASHIDTPPPQAFEFNRWLTKDSPYSPPRPPKLKIIEEADSAATSGTPIEQRPQRSLMDEQKIERGTVRQNNKKHENMAGATWS